MKKLLGAVLVTLAGMAGMLSFTSAGAETSVSEATPPPLILGVFPRRDPQITIRMFAPLAEYLESQLGRPVTLETAPAFTVFWERMEARRYDIVHFNQYHYVMARKALGYDVLVQNEEFGQDTIRGALYVRRDSGIVSLEQLRGRKVMFGGGTDAMMSYLVPRYLLLEAGLKRGDFEEVFASSPINAVLATHLGHADAGGAGDVVSSLRVVRERIDVNELEQIAVSEPMAHLPWAVKRETPQPLRDAIRSALLDLNTIPAGRDILSRAGLTGLRPVTDDAYEIHRRIADRVEDDL